MPSPLPPIRHLVLDMDGTIYSGSTLFDSTLPFLRTLDDLRIGYTFITNNSSLGIDDYLDKLRHLGIHATRDAIYTSTDAVTDYLGTHLPAARRISLLGTASMARQLEAAGFVIVDDKPDAVVVGFDTELTYNRLCRAAWWISQGLPFLASHPDRVCPSDRPTLLVDCGSITACLTAATGRSPTVLGKPDPHMLDGVCRRHHIRAQQLGVVGDRLYTDMVMAQRAGALSVLVLTGEATAEEAALHTPPPDLVVRDLDQLGRLLTNTLCAKEGPQ